MKFGLESKSVCVLCVLVTCSPQASIERAHSGCRLENLVCCPGNAVTGTNEGGRPRDPLTRRTSPVPMLVRVVCQCGGIPLIPSTAYGT